MKSHARALWRLRRVVATTLCAACAILALAALLAWPITSGRAHLFSLVMETPDAAGGAGTRRLRLELSVGRDEVAFILCRHTSAKRNQRLSHGFTTASSDEPVYWAWQAALLNADNSLDRPDPRWWCSLGFSGIWLQLDDRSRGNTFVNVGFSIPIWAVALLLAPGRRCDSGRLAARDVAANRGFASVAVTTSAPRPTVVRSAAGCLTGAAE